MSSHTDALAKKIWDYLQMRQPLEKADCILALGSYDARVAEKAAELWKQKWAPYIIFSGGTGRTTEDFPKPEAEVFADVAMAAGVPADKIIIENKSTNTGANIELSFKLLAEKKLDPQKIIIVTKPYMERRAYTVFKKLQPAKEAICASPDIAFEHMAYDRFSKEDIISIMVGDLQRIKIYPEKGYQIPQDIPADVWDAYTKLVDLGYNESLIH